MEHINRSMQVDHGGPARIEILGTQGGEIPAVRYTYPDGCWFEVFGSVEVEDVNRP
jgi:hypothetical protein